MFNKVLVVLDGSRFAEAILDPVERLVSGCSTTVILLGLTHSEEDLEGVVQGEVPPSLPFGFAVYPDRVIHGVESRTIETRDQAYDRLRAQLLGYLNGHAQRFRALGVDVITDVAVGDAAEAAISYAMNAGVDVVATATHARSGVAHLLNPGVAEKIVRSGVAPVLVVRSSTADSE
jgi:nucleotide-binding universal stress UspA family protein